VTYFNEDALARQKSIADIEIGRRIRLRRNQMKMTRKQLAEKVGRSYQMIQKYETAENSVSAALLQEIGEALDVSPTYFYLKYPVQEASRYAGGREDVPSAYEHDPQSAEVQALVKAFLAIRDAEVRRTIVSHLKSLAGTGDGEKTP
jgi:transcriptional regulator with XRE-family HTH domain